jgi:hypothetical protein
MVEPVSSVSSLYSQRGFVPRNVAAVVDCAYGCQKEN